MSIALMILTLRLMILANKHRGTAQHAYRAARAALDLLQIAFC